MLAKIRFKQDNTNESIEILPTQRVYIQTLAAVIILYLCTFANGTPIKTSKMNEKLSKLSQRFKQALTEDFDKEEVEVFFYTLLEFRHQLKRIDYHLRPDFEINATDTLFWNQAIERLKQQEPIQYITEAAWFFGRSYFVSPAVLIPRPETEELVEWIIVETANESNSKHRLLDIGTGSGCIPITLKAEGYLGSIEAWDVSERAIEVASKNANQWGVSINFVQQDLFAAPTPSAPYHVIVSNPPYVRLSEKAEMKPNVLRYEPQLALYVSNDDPLLYYREIAKFASSNLIPGGLLFFEINQYLSKETIELLTHLGFTEIQVRKDFRGNDRMLKAVKPYS